MSNNIPKTMKALREYIAHPTGHTDNETLLLMVDVEADVTRLQEILHWALGWVVAGARTGVNTREKYEHAVRMTGKPDPQAYRDRMPK